MTDIVVMYDQSIQRSRGFGFVSFETEDVVNRALYKTFHDLNGKQVEVKRVLPKDANPGERSYFMGGGAGSAFPPYGSSGYSAPGYGYGLANSGIGYDGYGGKGYGKWICGFFIIIICLFLKDMPVHVWSMMLRPNVLCFIIFLFFFNF